MPLKSRVTPDRAVLIGLLLTIALYCRDLRYDFILDDMPLIMTNQTIASWHNWRAVFLTHISSTGSPDVPRQIQAFLYRPVYVLWLMLNYQFFGPVLPWWHLTSLLLHIGVIFLVYKLGEQLLKEPWTAALAALLFAFHPIHVESVSYVAASTDLLATFFVLIAFLSYSRFREQGASPAYLIVSVLAAALAMLSKETAAMFPWMLVAYEALRETPSGPRWQWRRLIWTLPFFALVAIYASVRTLLFGFNLGAGPGGSRVAALLDTPLVLVAYLRNLFWPTRLSFFYPVEMGSQWTYGKAAAAVLVVAIAVLLWNHCRDRTGAQLQLLWIAILFVTPVTSISALVKEDWIHDRHMYLVSVPLCLLIAAFLTDPKVPLKASAVASSLVLTILLLETAMGVPRFTDDATVYASALKVSPRNVLVHSGYARSLWMYGRHDQALEEFRIATELSPGSAAAHDNYGAALAEIGREDEAAAEFAKALRWSPEHNSFRAFVLYELAAIEVKHSQPVQGAAHLQEALQISPQTPNYHALLSEALRQEGRTQEAEEQMRLETSLRRQFLRGPSAFP